MTGFWWTFTPRLVWKTSSIKKPRVCQCKLEPQVIPDPARKSTSWRRKDPKEKDLNCFPDGDSQEVNLHAASHLELIAGGLNTQPVACVCVCVSLCWLWHSEGVQFAGLFTPLPLSPTHSLSPFHPSFTLEYTIAIITPAGSFIKINCHFGSFKKKKKLTMCSSSPHVLPAPLTPPPTNSTACLSAI